MRKESAKLNMIDVFEFRFECASIFLAITRYMDLSRRHIVFTVSQSKTFSSIVNSKVHRKVKPKTIKSKRLPKTKKTVVNYSLMKQYGMTNKALKPTTTRIVATIS